MGGVPEKTRPKLRLVSSRGESANAPNERVSGTRGTLSNGDVELVRAVRQGDPNAAAEFHDRVRPQVDRTLRRLLGHGDVDHEDLAQLALIELVYTIDRYRGDCSLDSWASTLTAHVVYKQIRRRRTERRLFGGLTDDHLNLVGKHATHDAALRSTLARVLEHIRAMDESRAWTFVLHDVCGHDLREIAEITGASVAAAQSRLVRGRRELHDRIAGDPELADALEKEEEQ